MANCKDCGRKLGFLENTIAGSCVNCHNTHLANLHVSDLSLLAAQEAEAAERSELDKKIERILLTTETQLNIKIKERLGIVSAEVAYGMNVFKDLFASIRNIVGGRSEAIQNTMRDSRETVLFELKKEAHALGANAVVAVDLDYTQIGDSGWNMVLVVATGTAVIIEHDEAAGRRKD